MNPTQKNSKYWIDAHPARTPQSASPLAESRDRRLGNRSPLSVALIPFALLAITCGFSLVHRAAAAITHPAREDAAFGKMTAADAEKCASALCVRLTGSPVTRTDTSRQCAYSWRRHTVVREWNILCDSAQGQYLVRINADTRRVYAINRMDAPLAGIPNQTGDRDAYETFENPDGDSIPMTRGIAEERARQYLQIVGVPSEGLKQMEADPKAGDLCKSDDSAAQWNFTYRRAVPGRGQRLLKVSINGTTGNLEHVWNPVLAL
ncbi:MAG: hypothetical protein H7Z41_14445 [Cytophagales bacterium]|nr:hypothetical protein [Armatimonadota bacterium]